MHQSLSADQLHDPKTTHSIQKCNNYTVIVTTFDR